MSLFIAKMILLKSLFILVMEQNLLNIFIKSALIAGAGRLFFYGYSVKKERKVYDTLNSTTKYLVTSRETAFAVDLCYETTLHILHNNATFQGLADVYNHFHYFKSTYVELNLTERDYSYSFLSL